MKQDEKKFALISVSDKTGIDKFAKSLIKNNYIILSTGGTAKFLSSKKIANVSIAEFTKFEEILEGRVKTLHPIIHAGILAKDKKSIDSLKNSHYSLIDIVAVNLYPFESTISKPNCKYDDAIENIDIGGPTMLRAAAKNHRRVTVITEPKDYDVIIKEINENNQTSIDTRLKLAIKVFQKISEYDSMIHNYLMSHENTEESTLPSKINITLEKINDLRYGENPHQNASLYNIKYPQVEGFNFEQLSGKGLSYNNLVDTESALSCVQQFKTPSCVIVKHANPCGVAECTNLMAAYNNAYATDPISAFGGIIAFNKNVDEKILKKIINQQFVEVIVAPSYSKKCLEIIKSKPNIRLLKTKRSNKDIIRLEFKSLQSKFLIQESDTKKLTSKDLKNVTVKKPSKREIDDLLFAFKVARYVKSNAIVFVKNKKTLGIGAGQMSRIDSTNIAKTKAKKHGLSLKGCVMASEAFFPFRDNIDLAKKIGVSSIIQPGGSIKDKEIISITDKHGISMVLSGVRVFKH